MAGILCRTGASLLAAWIVPGLLGPSRKFTSARGGTLIDKLSFLKGGAEGGAVSADEERLMQLFQNRAGLKKAYADLKDEFHLLRDRLKQGDADAAQRLWERYFARLVQLAHNKLGSLPRGAADAEDVALSAFASFCQASEDSRFPRLNDRADLWQLLVMLTATGIVSSTSR